jgi:PAS domain S-box-containing protein
MTHPSVPGGIDICLWLTTAIGQTSDVDEMCAAALEAIDRGLGVPRSAILLFDEDGAMRFRAWRGLSAEYRSAVERHSPWATGAVDLQPLVVADVTRDAGLAAYRPVFAAEGIAGLASVPLVSRGRRLGTFTLYFDAPESLDPSALQLTVVIASQVAVAIERMRAQQNAQHSEERLRFALDAANMGTWEWDLRTNAVRWSANLHRIHGLEPGAFGGTFEAYRQEIHADDVDRVIAATRRTVELGTPLDVEYRVWRADGQVRWLEGKGRVEYSAGGEPLRVSGVCTDVTHRKMVEIDRLVAAQESNRLKDEFLAVLSHELRTPLSAIIGWLQVIRTGALSAERTREAMQVIERNALLQAQLIEQILDVSRIVAGKLDIHRQPVLLPVVVANAINAITPAAVAKQLVLTSEAPHGLPPLDADPERLQQVLGNVLGNAVKFTPPGGRISLECAVRGSRVIITVSDSGCGIAPEFLPYVFERFRQADGGVTRAHGGLGLGLAIARHLVELHGGAMTVESAGQGQGTTFGIELPTAATLHPVVDPVTTPLQLRPVQHRDTLRGRRVLVVDDEPDTRQLLASLFQEQGSEVAQVESASEALARLHGEAFHMLIADIGMPQMDGCALIRQVRLFAPVLPAIAVTAYARPEDRSRALDAGFDAFHSKPFNAAALLRTARDLTAPQPRDAG